LLNILFIFLVFTKVDIVCFQETKLEVMSHSVVCSL
jgi:exonuclease III